MSVHSSSVGNPRLQISHYDRRIPILEMLEVGWNSFNYYMSMSFQSFEMTIMTWILCQAKAHVWKHDNTHGAGPVAERFAS